MKRFQNILVGIELHPTDNLQAAQPAPNSLAAVERATELAKTSGARLTFFTSIGSLGPEPLLTPQQIETATQNIHKAASAAMSQLVEQASREGINSISRVGFGKAWYQIVRQVLIEQHDLVIVGSRGLSDLRRFVVGSTGTKLLRKCPCAVWVTKPKPNFDISTILAATDFGLVSKFACGLAASLARIHSAKLHLLHCAEYPLEHGLKWAHIPAEYRNEYRQRVFVEAKDQFDLELNRPDYDGLAERPHVHLKSNQTPHDAILAAVDELDADLLVMGTLARGGISGLFLGNTSEQVLPHVTCSVLVVKPDDFVCPVQVESEQEQDRLPVQVAVDST